MTPAFRALVFVGLLITYLFTDRWKINLEMKYYGLITMPIASIDREMTMSSYDKLLSLFIGESIFVWK